MSHAPHYKSARVSAVHTGCDATAAIRTIRVADGVTHPFTYVDNREADVPIR